MNDDDILKTLDVTKMTIVTVVANSNAALTKASGVAFRRRKPVISNHTRTGKIVAR